MIFATVGTQLPFPRLLQTLDAIAARHKLEVFAQTCDPGLNLSYIKSKPNLEPKEFDQHFKAARVVVSHAGIGTILSAKRHGKPLILMPRRASLGEHRNEHQLATVQQLSNLPGLYVANDEAELEALLLAKTLAPANNEVARNRSALIAFLRDYIDGGN